MQPISRIIHRMICRKWPWPGVQTSANQVLSIHFGTENLARTSGKPGKTQLLNFYNIDDKLRFVDVPGYGYAKVSKADRAKWGKMIEEYLTSRDNLRAVVSLVDFRHDPSADDVQMYDFLKYYDIPVILVATKADKVPAANGTSMKRP